MMAYRQSDRQANENGPNGLLGSELKWNPGLLFTKRTDVLPQELVKSQIREIRI